MHTRLCKMGRKIEIMPRSSKKEQRRTAATGSMGGAHLGEIKVTRVKWWLEEIKEGLDEQQRDLS